MLNIISALFPFNIRLKSKKHLIIVVMKLTNEEIQKIEKLLRDSSYAKYHKRLQIIYFRSKEKSYKENHVSARLQ